MPVIDSPRFLLPKRLKKRVTMQAANVPFLLIALVPFHIYLRPFIRSRGNVQPVAIPALPATVGQRRERSELVEMAFVRVNKAGAFAVLRVRSRPADYALMVRPTPQVDSVLSNLRLHQMREAFKKRIQFHLGKLVGVVVRLRDCEHRILRNGEAVSRGDLQEDGLERLGGAIDDGFLRVNIIQR